MVIEEFLTGTEYPCYHLQTVNNCAMISSRITRAMDGDKGLNTEVWAHFLKRGLYA